MAPSLRPRGPARGRRRSLGVLTGVAAALLVAVMLPLPSAGRDARCLLGRVAATGPLNRLKDRMAAPGDADVDHKVTLAAMLAPGDDRRRFDVRRAAEVEAVVVDVKVGGVEAVNCFALLAAGRDAHVDLALAPGAPPIARVVAEVTPGWRARMRAGGADWSTRALRRELLGRRVRVRGWLLFDEGHVDEALHTDPADRRGQPNWRATGWEIHPVTAITVVP